MSGADKAAILLRSLGANESAEIYKTMTEAEIKRVESAMKSLGRVEQEVTDGVLKEFRQILQLSTKSNPSDEIRQLMFVFDDITRIDDFGIQELVKNVAHDKWSAALKTASEQVLELVFKGMSDHSARALKKAIEEQPAITLAAVETAQSDIVQVARRLAVEGKIVIKGAT